MKLKPAIYLLIIILMVSCSIQPNNNYEISFTGLNTNTDASLRGLHVVDENVIWASGSSGTVLNSEDGGKSWNVFHVDGAMENDFRSIHAWDKNSAMVFGIAGPEFGTAMACIILQMPNNSLPIFQR